MGTRACFAMLENDGTVSSRYVHSDGYVADWHKGDVCEGLGARLSKLSAEQYKEELYGDLLEIEGDEYFESYTGLAQWQVEAISSDKEFAYILIGDVLFFFETSPWEKDAWAKPLVPVKPHLLQLAEGHIEELRSMFS
jgi:hypothetical protein